MIRDFFRIQKINSDSHGGGSCGGGGQEASQLTGCNKKNYNSSLPCRYNWKHCRYLECDEDADSTRLLRQRCLLLQQRSYYHQVITTTLGGGSVAAVVVLALHPRCCSLSYALGGSGLPSHRSMSPPCSRQLA